MKKITLFLTTAILFCSAANAQLKKGDILFGTDIGNLFGRLLGERHPFDVNVSPFVAKFVTDKFAVGGKMSIGTDGHENQSIQHSFEISALGRYYFGDANSQKRFRLFGEATAGFKKIDRYPYFEHKPGFGYGFGAGGTYFITPNIGLEGMLKYEGLANTKGSYDKLNVTVGLSIFLPSRKRK